MTKASTKAKETQKRPAQMSEPQKKPARKFYKKWWFWLIITVAVVALITGGIVVAVYLRSGKVTDADRQMMSKYYPDFTLSNDDAVRKCQLSELRQGVKYWEADENHKSNNPNSSSSSVIYQSEVKAEKCGNSIHDGGNVALKPILYLYPTKDTNVNVNLQIPGQIDTSYPKYGVNGWSVLAQPNGDLTDASGKKYYALYWDEKGAKPVDFSTGFYVEKDGAAKFLEDKLTQIGLNDRERNEFIMYWLPKLEHNGKSLVYFALTNELQAHNKLNISPMPDSLLRVRMYMKKVDLPVNIAPENLPQFNRQGFVAVEWGGTEQ